jgi:hypothetical protein
MPSPKTVLRVYPIESLPFHAGFVSPGAEYVGQCPCGLPTTSFASQLWRSAPSQRLISSRCVQVTPRPLDRQRAAYVVVRRKALAKAEPFLDDLFRDDEGEEVKRERERLAEGGGDTHDA